MVFSLQQGVNVRPMSWTPSFAGKRLEAPTCAWPLAAPGSHLQVFHAWQLLASLSLATQFHSLLNLAVDLAVLCRVA